MATGIGKGFDLEQTILSTLVNLTQQNVNDIKHLFNIKDDIDHIQNGFQLYNQLKKENRINDSLLDYLTTVLRNNNCENIANQLHPRGRCLIINNHRFDRSINTKVGLDPDVDPNLPGYISDIERIKKVFGPDLLNFDIKERTNLYAADITKQIDRWCADDYTKDECLALFLLSHGGDDGVVIGCDGEYIRIEDVVDKFCKCPSLKDKPKLFFIQACRGNSTPQATEIKKDESIYKKTGIGIKSGKHRNTFLYYSTCDGYSAFVKAGGSIFLSALSKNLEASVKSGNCELWDLVTLVNREVSEDVFAIKTEDHVAQCPEVVSTLTEPFWFLRTDGAKGRSRVPKMGTRSGPCIIIRNSECPTHKNQQLFESAEDHIRNAFTDFKVEPHENQTFKDIKSIFKNVKTADYKSADCFVCVLLACGGEKNEDTEKPVIYGTDTIFYAVEKMINKVCENEDLKGKPKMFFMMLNNCSKAQLKAAGFGENASEKVNVKKIWRSQHADVFIYYNILNDGQTQSQFMSELSRLLMGKGKGCHLGEITCQLNKSLKELGSNEVPEMISTLTSLVSFGTPVAQVEEDPPRTDQEVESIHAAAAAAAVDTAALEKRMQALNIDHEAASKAKLKEKTIRDKVLKQKLNEMPWLPISRVMDPLDGVWQKVLMEFRYSAQVMNDIQRSRYGGGKTHQRALDYLGDVNSDIKIDDVMEAFEKCGMQRAKDCLEDQSEGKEYFSDLYPHQRFKLEKFVDEDLCNNTKKSWVDVFEYLKLSSVIPTLKATIEQGGNYSPTEALLKHLYQDNKKVGDLLKGLEAVEEAKLVLDAFNEQIQKKVNKEMKKELKKLGISEDNYSSWKAPVPTQSTDTQNKPKPKPKPDIKPKPKRDTKPDPTPDSKHKMSRVPSMSTDTSYKPDESPPTKKSPGFPAIAQEADGDYKQPHNMKNQESDEVPLSRVRQATDHEADDDSSSSSYITENRDQPDGMEFLGRGNSNEDDRIFIEPDLQDLPAQIATEIGELERQIESGGVDEHELRNEISKRKAPFRLKGPPRKALSLTVQQKLDDLERELNENELTEHGYKKRVITLLREANVELMQDAIQGGSHEGTQTPENAPLPMVAQDSDGKTHVEISTEQESTFRLEDITRNISDEIYAPASINNTQSRNVRNGEMISPTSFDASQLAADGEDSSSEEDSDEEPEILSPSSASSVLSPPTIMSILSQSPKSFYMTWSVDPDIAVLALTLCYKKDGTDIWKELHLSNNNIKEKKIVLSKMKSWQKYNVKLKMTANGVDVESDSSSVLVKGKGAPPSN